jgi:hypothetical protein
VGDHLRQLDRKPKMFRHGCGPAFVGYASMWPLEAGVDFDRVEQGCIALEVRAFSGELGSMLSPDAPPSRTEMDIVTRGFVWNIGVQHPSLCSIT